MRYKKLKALIGSDIIPFLNKAFRNLPSHLHLQIQVQLAGMVLFLLILSTILDK